MGDPGTSPIARFEQIRSFFIARNNEWATIAKLAAIGIPKDVVTQIVYNARPNEFERRGRYASGQRFRLRRYPAP
jgi:hypothetical protein